MRWADTSRRRQSILRQFVSGPFGFALRKGSVFVIAAGAFAAAAIGWTWTSTQALAAAVEQLLPERSEAAHGPRHVAQIHSAPDSSVSTDPCERWHEPSEAVRVVFQDETEKKREIEGRVLVRAQDGGLLLVGRDGHLWTVTPDRLITQQTLGRPFSPFNEHELGEVLQKELRARLSKTAVQVLHTRNYVIVTTASIPYARWAGSLLERLYDAFRRFWRAARLRLCGPPFPMSAIVLANREQFIKLANEELGTELAGVTGFYSITANRMVLYDLTAQAGDPQVRGSAELVRRLAKQPDNVATIVHEATHQIAFNSGFHRRYVDNPLWLVEGVATFFETPDLTSSSGWRTVGKPNPARLRAFRRYLASGRPPDSLRTLVATDQRLLSPKTGMAAYAEAWALTYFLVHCRRKQLVQYVELIRSKPLLRPDSPEQRLRDFELCFGTNWRELDRQLIAFLQTLR